MDSISAKFLDILAKERAGFNDWQAERKEVVNYQERDRPAIFKLVGAVYEPITRGSRAGKPNWKKFQHKQTLFITEGELMDRAIRYAADTGKCYRCMGEGQEVTGWSAADGVNTRECRRCLGTGLDAKAETR